MLRMNSLFYRSDWILCSCPSPVHWHSPLEQKIHTEHSKSTRGANVVYHRISSHVEKPDIYEGTPLCLVVNLFLFHLGLAFPWSFCIIILVFCSALRFMHGLVLRRIYCWFVDDFLLVWFWHQSNNEYLNSKFWSAWKLYRFVIFRFELCDRNKLHASLNILGTIQGSGVVPAASGMDRRRCWASRPRRRPRAPLYYGRPACFSGGTAVLPKLCFLYGMFSTLVMLL